MTGQLDLPPDQNAVLSLLLRQRKSYAQVAALLRIEPRTVQNRAYQAIATLGAGEGTSLMRTHREEIADYLLFQRPSISPDTASYLANLSGARQWATTVRAQLQTIAPGPLPQLPVQQPTPSVGAPPEPTLSTTPPPPSPPVPAPEPPTVEPVPESTLSQPVSPPISRRGGALLLLALAVIIAVAVILIVNHSNSSTSSSAAVNSATTRPSTTASRPHIDSQINLSSPSGGQEKGVAEVVSQGTQRAFYIVAEHLPPTVGFFYVAWLYDSPSHAIPLGKAPNVTASERMQGAGPLPRNAGEYHHLILTRESSEQASRPGHIVLSGVFRTHSRLPRSAQQRTGG